MGFNTLSKQVIITGGGAAGFFTAINCAIKNPGYHITILERTSTVLNKVKISGGGRCNVTHACFDPKELVKFYPRGEKQLLGPFNRFNPTNTIQWFADRGVKIKREADGRIFPVTDNSQTIIDCFMAEVKRLGINVKYSTGVNNLIPVNNSWEVHTTNGQIIKADVVVVTAGSSHGVWDTLKQLGHTIVPAVPSLFTFNIKDERIKGLEGLSVPQAQVTVVNTKLQASGPLLITHWGMSGPAILRLSAWGARGLSAINHHFEIEVNWISGDLNNVKETIKQYKQNHPKKGVTTTPLFDIPKRLWERITAQHITKPGTNYADLSNSVIDTLAAEITRARYKVAGKSTNKDEFVTAGGVDLAEVDFRTMQSKKHSNLYFAGEVLDIDAITGGFNFQAAWTTAYIASQTI
ncbi:MAG TPA: NAD(P)/FAD-dependent oxidoreductase [Chitinophagales bacterium]|nr:NAD(P)/FAD-dependent oxidoreductase [Chitinophagales bacterium]